MKLTTAQVYSEEGGHVLLRQGEYWTWIPVNNALHLFGSEIMEAAKIAKRAGYEGLRIEIAVNIAEQTWNIRQAAKEAENGES